MGFSLRLGAGPVSGGRRNPEIWLQQRGGSRFLRIPFHGGGKFPARRNDTREIQRGDALFGNAGHRGISHEHRGIWLDERSISFAAAPTSRKFRDPTG